MVRIIHIVDIYGNETNARSPINFFKNSADGLVQRVSSDLVPYKKNVSVSHEENAFDSGEEKVFDSDERDPSDYELRRIEEEYSSRKIKKLSSE